MSVCGMWWKVLWRLVVLSMAGTIELGLGGHNIDDMHVLGTCLIWTDHNAPDFITCLQASSVRDVFNGMHRILHLI